MEQYIPIVAHSLVNVMGLKGPEMVFSLPRELEKLWKPSVALKNPLTKIELPGLGIEVSLAEWYHGYLYDRTSITATSTELTYFAVPQGQSSKTYADTNLILAGQMPQGWQMFAYSIGVVSESGITAADADLILNNSWLEFTVGGTGKLFAQGPLILFPGGAGLAGTGTGIVTLGQATRTAAMRLSIPIEINGGDTIQGKIKLSSAQSGLSASRNFWMVLEGLIKRTVG